jgi:protein-tyrosine phosphatase
VVDIGAAGGGRGGERLRVLFVCTANTGRSALADALLRHQLRERAVAATVRSAGHRTEGGEPVSELVEQAARAHGGQLSGYRSRTLTADLLEDADVVLAMAGEHRDAAARLLPTVAGRTFLLRDLLRRTRATGRRHRDEPVSTYLSRLGAAPAAETEDGLEVADPYGQPLEVLTATAAELDSLLRELVNALFPPGINGGGGSPPPGSR